MDRKRSLAAFWTLLAAAPLWAVEAVVPVRVNVPLAGSASAAVAGSLHLRLGTGLNISLSLPSLAPSAVLQSRLLPQAKELAAGGRDGK